MGSLIRLTRLVMSETSKLLKITDELERHENFWRDKEDDTYGINLSVAMAINSVRRAVLSAIVEEDELSSHNTVVE